MAGFLNYIRNSKIVKELSLGTAGTLLLSSVAVAGEPSGYVTVGDRYDAGEPIELMTDSNVPMQDSGTNDPYSAMVPQTAKNDTIWVSNNKKKKNIRYAIFEYQVKKIEEIAGFLNGSIVVLERDDQPGTCFVYGNYKPTSKKEDYGDLLKAIESIDEYGIGDRIIGDGEIKAFRDKLHKDLEERALRGF